MTYQSPPSVKNEDEQFVRGKWSKSNFIIGREAEIKILQEALKSSSAELAAMYGRQRIGKISKKACKDKHPYTLYINYLSL